MVEPSTISSDGFDGFSEKVSESSVKDGPGVIPGAAAGTVIPPGTTTPAFEGRTVKVSPFNVMICGVDDSWIVLLPITISFEGP